LTIGPASGLAWKKKASGMRIRETIVAAGLLSITAATLAPREAAAQTPPVVMRDKNWDIVSNVTMVAGASIVSLMPRVFFNDPEATVGWKGRWHISALAPIMSMTALTLMVDISVKNAIKTTRPGCTVDGTVFPLTECASYGAPSTQSYAAWGATGAGTGIFLVDTIKYSDGRFNVPYFLGEVIAPLTLSVLSSVGRAVEPGTSQPYESGGAIVAGALTGFASGLIVGGAYALLQKPSCGFGNNVFCW
jgi:hypothetical protein